MDHFKPSKREKKFSIILPTIRPTLAHFAIDNIRACSSDVNYEIVVVSPFPVVGNKIVHVPETEPKGNCAAHAMGYQAATGDIIVAMSDDHLPLDDWLTYVESIIEEKEKLYFPFVGGLNLPFHPYFGTCYGLYYPYFPVMSRKTADAIGGYFSRDYIAHFGDPDIGMRVWKAGGRCEMMFEANIAFNPHAKAFGESDHKNTTRERDLWVFRAHHHSVLGSGFDETFKGINSDYLFPQLRERTFMAKIPRTLYEERLLQKKMAALQS